MGRFREILATLDEGSPLSTASEDVIRLWRGDDIVQKYKSQLPEERDGVWKYRAERNDDFTDKMLELRRELNIAADVKDSHGPETMQYFADAFPSLKDSDDAPNEAKRFLRDLLIARLSSDSGKLEIIENFPERLQKESTAMLTEVGFSGFGKLREVTLTRVVGAVLTGKLKLRERQPAKN